MSLLASWENAFRKLVACPWPGPKPLQRGEYDQLVGRDDDLSKLGADVLDHALVVLTGGSGVGKSSFLNAGLTHSLPGDGFVPLICNDWAPLRGSTVADAETFIGSKLAAQGSEVAGVVFSDPGSVIAQLDSVLGHRACLVLDQFEELIRYQPDLVEMIVDWLAELTFSRRIHVVLSLRVEFSHQLDGLRSRVRPFQMVDYELEPLVDPDVIEQIVREGHFAVPAPGADGPQPELIADGAVKELLAYWNESHAGTTQSGGAVGLLHLQAALFSLYRRSHGATIQANLVRKMAAESGGKFFEQAVVEAVRHKLEACVAACRYGDLERPLDPFLVEGTAAVVQRLVPRLASGGYKIPWEEWHLAHQTLEEELERLGAGRDYGRAVFRALSGQSTDGTDDPGADLLGVPAQVFRAIAEAEVSADSVIKPVDQDPHYLVGVGLDVAPWVADPGDVTSGPMLGMDPALVVVEELRRFVFGLRWLQSAALVRESASASVAGESMISLIHDGFGEAVERWATRQAAGPLPWLNLLTGAYGRRLAWKGDKGLPHAEFDGAKGAKLVVNVRWRDCEVSAAFRRVTFVNCDFRGTRFEDCDFRGAVFINCLLDGAAFSGCRILGRVGSPAKEKLSWGRMPDFWIPAGTHAADVIGHYRGSPAGGEGIFSITSGVPGLPKGAGHVEGFPWRAHTGGLSMYGGRLSSLMIRGCDIESGSALAFRQIAGSSLDLVEQRGGRVDIFDSIIRGLTITSPVEELRQVRDPLGSRRQDQGGVGVLNLSVKSSLLAETWFGDGLVGVASFDDCRLWQLWNSADRGALKVAITNCAHHGLVNVDPPDARSIPMAGIGSEAIANRESIALESRRMDYRSTPARWELEERLRDRRRDLGGVGP